MVDGLDQEDHEAIIDKNQVRDCLVYFEWLAKKNKLPFEDASSVIDRFFINYINLYQTHPEEIRLCLSKKDLMKKVLYTKFYTLF